MRPMLADTELPQVARIVTADRRALAEQHPPGMDGSLVQDLGRAATEITIEGVASDPAALDLLTVLKDTLRAGEPVPFIADITTDSRIEAVLFDDLRLEQQAGTPDRYSYELVLLEYVEPIDPQPATGGELDAGLLEEATGRLDELMSGLDLALPFATGLERFVAPLSELLGRLPGRGG